jgi:hypothetical protein
MYWLLQQAHAPSIVARETVPRENTKLDLTRETALSGQHDEEAGHSAEV